MYRSQQYLTPRSYSSNHKLVAAQAHVIGGVRENSDSPIV
jgi:hypothetical protein